MEKSKTNLYLVSIVGIVAVVGIVILLLQSSQQTLVWTDEDITGQATSTTCTDTDSGFVYTTQGTVTGSCVLPCEEGTDLEIGDHVWLSEEEAGTISANDDEHCFELASVETDSCIFFIDGLEVEVSVGSTEIIDDFSIEVSDDTKTVFIDGEYQEVCLVAIGDEEGNIPEEETTVVTVVEE